jgi:hypothetical protein
VTDIPPRLAEALRDRYRLERALGRGGMGAVYLAEDLKHHRKVAVNLAVRCQLSGIPKRARSALTLMLCTSAHSQ